MLDNSDAAFLADFEDCRIPNARFGHRAHVRAAWAFIKRYGLSEGAMMMEACVRRFAARHGHARKYHHTITAAWMKLVAVHALPHPARTFDEFIETHSRLLDARFIERFYSHETLFSDYARGHWTEPDVRPLPGIP
ncbi:MAG TPA: hypothetical protein VN860_04870 [Candidatus Acidoferrales bacterium]|nr:hypothetical protein [Candidatus Acidoferrales bacterium]